LTEAIALFEQAGRAMGRNPLPRFNVGGACLWLWRLDEAETALDAASRMLQGRPLRVIAAPLLMLISALKNEPARVQERAAELARLQLERGAVAAMARAVMAARAGSWAEVQRELSLERMRPLGGPARAMADALRAWAITEAGGACPPIDAVGVFGETGPAAVARWWPAFAEFLQRHA
jgi:enoyl-CoA hydratase/carnithine racemase